MLVLTSNQGALDQRIRTPSSRFTAAALRSGKTRGWAHQRARASSSSEPRKEMIWNHIAPCRRIHGIVIMADPLQYKNQRPAEILLSKRYFYSERQSFVTNEILLKSATF